MKIVLLYLLVQIVSSGLLLVTLFEKQNQTTAERIKNLPHLNSEEVKEGNKFSRLPEDKGHTCFQGYDHSLFPYGVLELYHQTYFANKNKRK